MDGPTFDNFKWFLPFLLFTPLFPDCWNTFTVDRIFGSTLKMPVKEANYFDVFF